VGARTAGRLGRGQRLLDKDQQGEARYIRGD